MRIIVIGATGTIGRAIADELAKRHEVLRASRHGEVRVDLEDVASIEAMLAGAGEIDAVVSAAGEAKFGSALELGEADYAASLKSKLMGQVNLARLAMKRVRPSGSITLTSGILGRFPTPGSAALALVNGALEAFVRASALDLAGRARINVVSPPWVKETMVALGMDPTPGLPAATVARAYAESVEGARSGETLDARDFA